MDTIVTIAAWTIIVLAALILLAKLLRPRGADEDVGENIAALLGGAVSVILAGRALGWW